MLRIYDFRCDNNHTTEQYVSGNPEVALCTECGEEAKRIISGGNFSLDAVSGDYPGATMKWAREHEKAAKARN